MATYLKGLTIPRDLSNRIKLSHVRHGVRLAALPQATEAAYDARDDGLVTPVDDQGNCGDCFAKGTLIRLADGSDVPIEKVTTSDSVLTAEGNIRRVTHTMRRHENESLMTLVMWGHYHLRATKNHPIYTKRGYVFLKDVVPGDWVGFPKYAPETSKLISTADFIYERNTSKHSVNSHRSRVPETTSSRTIGIPGKTQVTITKTAVPDVIHLTPMFGRLVGLYLAEGSTDRSRVRWSFHIREKDSFAAEVVAAAKECLGMDAHVSEKPLRNLVEVTLYGANLARLFDSLFSHGSANKSIHAEIMAGPKEFLESILTGWMDGDRQSNNRAVSISRRLSLAMFHIANAIGKMPTLATHQKGKTGSDGIFREHAWSVGINDPETYHRGAATQDDTHMWRKVCEVTEEKYEGDVYNLEIDGDHSYVAEGVGVHNCWNFSGVDCAQMASIKAGWGTKDNTDWSKQSVLDCGSNGGCNGDWMETALEQCKNSGIADTKDYHYTGGRGACKVVPHQNTIDDYGYVGDDAHVPPVQAVKNALKAYGPLAVAVAADQAFMDYSGGVFLGSGSTDIDHAIKLVAWKDDASIPSGGYWVVQNNWGTSWGESGYMRMAYGANMIGYAAMWAKKNPKAPPGFTLSASPPSGAAPLHVTFTATGGTIATLDFGDGVHTDTLSLEHTYTSTGTFTATATALSPVGTKSSVMVSVGVVPPPPPTFSVTTTGTVPGQTLTFAGPLGRTYSAQVRPVTVTSTGTATQSVNLEPGAFQSECVGILAEGGEPPQQADWQAPETAEELAATLTGMGMDSHHSGKVADTVFAFKGAHEPVRALVAIVARVEMADRQGAIDPANLAAILAFLMAILPIILQLFGG